MPPQIPLRHNAPDPAARPMAEAVAHHQAGRLPNAETCYREVLAVTPNHGDALRLLGTLYLQINKPAEALPVLQDALKVQPKNPEILNNVGIAFRDVGRNQEAAVALQQALTVNPNYAEALNNLGSVLQNQGQAAEAIPYYEKAIRQRPDYATALGNLATALRVESRFEEAVERYKKALRTTPADTKLWVGLGLAQEGLRHLPEAEASFREALRITPHDAELLNELGTVLRLQDKIDAALDCFAKALQVRAQFPEAYVNMGACWWEKNSLRQAILCYELALTQKPDMPDALVNLSVALWGLGRVKEACEKIDRAMQIDPLHAEAMTMCGAFVHDEGNPEAALDFYNCALAVNPNCRNAMWRKSIALLALGQYREGWKLYESGLGLRNVRGVMPFQGPSWDGKPMPDKHLVIWCEQGYGDALQFIRYAELCKQRVGKVSVLCPKPLVRLFKSLPYIDDAFDVVEGHVFDAHVAMLSLPHVFETVVETVPATVPYLHIDEDLRKKWAEKFSRVDGFKVGLVWAGSTHGGKTDFNMMDLRRSVGLERMKPLLDIMGARFYALQKDEAAEQIKTLNLQGRLTDFMPEVVDFADTAALVDNLDLVITVDTSVAHVAGGLGKPVWILSRYDACWRWLQNKPENPWYPSARIFGQPTLGDWDSVMAKVEQELKSLVTKG